eukprot:9502503-Pyramimonas_sp.AAC.2
MARSFPKNASRFVLHLVLMASFMSYSANYLTAFNSRELEECAKRGAIRRLSWGYHNLLHLNLRAPHVMGKQWQGSACFAKYVAVNMADSARGAYQPS